MENFSQEYIFYIFIVFNRKTTVNYQIKNI